MRNGVGVRPVRHRANEFIDFEGLIIRASDGYQRDAEKLRTRTQFA